MIRLFVSFACCAGVCMASALVATAAPSDSRAKLAGKTGQGRQIVMRISGNHVKLLRFSVQLRCRDGSTLVDAESGFEPTPLRRGGSFRDRQVGSTDVVQLRGRLRQGRVRGRLRVTDRVGRVRCDSRWVKFSAKPRRR